MALRQLANRCAGAARQLVTSQALATAQETVQQQAGRQSAVFQHLTASMRQDLQRHYSQVFQPSRLYPKQHTTGEAYAFWGLIGLNLALTFASKTALPDIKQFILTNFRTSIEAVAGGRVYTLLTSSVCHTSAVHCAINLLMLAIFRRTQPLTAKELLLLYFAGALVGSCSHLVWCWFDASGPEFGLRYAINTPGFLGCSGAVAAVSAYKSLLEPMGVAHIGSVALPLPMIAVTLLYCCTYIREEEYSDYAGKFGAAAFGILAALFAVGSGRRLPSWSRRP